MDRVNDHRHHSDLVGGGNDIRDRTLAPAVARLWAMPARR
jgi:hypothetical protein